MTDPFRLDGSSDGAPELLRAFFARLRALDEEAQGIAGDKKDVLAEAKSAGFEPTVLTLMVRRARKDPSAIAEGDVLLETYEAITGSGAGAAGTLAMTKNAEGVFEPRMIQGGGAAAEQKLTRSARSRRAHMAAAELAAAARAEGGIA